LAVYSAHSLDAETSSAEWRSNETLDSLGTIFQGHEVTGEAQNSEGCVVFSGRNAGEMSVTFRLPDSTLKASGAEHLIRLALSHIPEAEKFEIQVNGQVLEG